MSAATDFRRAAIAREVPTLGACQREHAEAVRLADDLASLYLRVRVLPDNSVAALLELLYTRAIVLGCTAHGYARRFCFEDRSLAVSQFEALSSEDDEPAGFIASRGVLLTKSGRGR